MPDDVVVLTPEDADDAQVIKVGGECYRRVLETDGDPTHDDTDIESVAATCDECIGCPTDCDECPSTFTVTLSGVTSQPCGGVSSDINGEHELTRSGCTWHKGVGHSGNCGLLLMCEPSLGGWLVQITNDFTATQRTAGQGFAPCPPTGNYGSVGDGTAIVS